MAAHLRTGGRWRQLTFAFAVVAWSGCWDSGPPDPPERLSEHGLFVGELADQLPRDGVVPYAINTPLFSDSAEKLRFVALPPDKPATYRDEGSFAFPVGTRLVKTFLYPADARVPEEPRRLIETRVLTHEAGGWTGAAYVWNAEQTEAYLRLTGARVPVEWIDDEGRRQSIEYRVPSVAECGLCHRTDGESIAPIATKAAQLNRPLARDASQVNQLATWSSQGRLDGLPELDLVPRFPVWDDETSGNLEARARAYLDANCAHCHSPSGPAGSSGLDLRYAQRDPARIGVFKRPRAAGRGSGDLVYDIWPGRPDASILMYRMESIEPGIMMPELGRLTGHRDGNTLIRAWIASMAETDPPSPML